MRYLSPLERGGFVWLQGGDADEKKKRKNDDKLGKK